MNSLLNKSWHIKSPFDPGMSVLKRILSERKLDLDNEVNHFHSPWLLKNMEKAVERVKKALQAKERIMIFGDYDVDGVSGASILYLGLKELGGNVSVRLPHREKDGYGLNKNAVKESAKLGVGLMITVDCGISNNDEIDLALALGLDVIITDHHAIPPRLPDAYTILNPHQEGCEYPDKEICGSVVAFKLIMALFERAGKEDTAMQEYIDMAALATVADCMPLRGENRYIVKQGLLQFRQTKHRGLRTLMESYDLFNPENEIKCYHLGFNIAPCINAAGRLDDPLIAFKMMMGDTEKALELRQINAERQDIVRDALEEAIIQVERDHKEDPILVFWADNWPPGIVGLLAGRLCERYHKPVICLTRHEDKFVGSCRSIPEINIVERLQENEDLFLNYGGHAQAAGLSIKEENLPILRERMISNISAFLAEHPITPTLFVDTELLPEEISLDLCDEIHQLEPFGMGNPKPKFLLKNLEIVYSKAVGKDQNHLQVGFRHGSTEWKGIAFQMAEYQTQLNTWKKVDILCQLNKNHFRGNTTVDLQLVDARPTQED